MPKEKLHLYLEDAEKRSLFQRIFACLRPGGAFINADQIRGEPPFDLVGFFRSHQIPFIGSATGGYPAVTAFVWLDNDR